MIKFIAMVDAHKAAFRTANIEALVLALQSYPRQNEDAVRLFAQQQVDQELAEAGHSSLETILTIVDEAEDQIIGSLWYRLHSEPVYADLVFVCWIQIEIPYRRRGFAKAALNQLSQQLSENGITRMALQVYNNNSTALKLYESLGFEPKRTILHKYFSKV